MPMLLPQRKGGMGEVNAREIERWEGQIGGVQSKQNMQGQSQRDRNPPLPPRRGTGLGQGQTQGQKNLLDDEEDGMAAWKPLRPN
jgi:hypothetical protein